MKYSYPVSFVEKGEVYHLPYVVLYYAESDKLEILPLDIWGNCVDFRRDLNKLGIFYLGEL